MYSNHMLDRSHAMMCIDMQLHCVQYTKTFFKDMSKPSLICKMYDCIYIIIFILKSIPYKKNVEKNDSQLVL